MASPGPQQRFNHVINRISFPPPGGGLVFFTFEFQDQWLEVNPTPGGPAGPIGVGSTMPSVYNGTFRFDSSIADISDLGSLNIFDTIRVVPEQLSEKEKEKVVPLVNPTTKEMLLHYAAWTPFSPYDDQRITSVAGFDVYVIDTAQFTGIYNHMNTFRVTPWNWTRDQSLNYFKGSGLLPGQDANLVAVDFLDPFGFPWPSLPAARTVQALAEGGGSWHTEPAVNGNAYGRRGIGYLILNLGPIKKMLTTQNKDAKSFSFDIRMPKKTGLKWKLQGTVIPNGFNRNITINPSTHYPSFPQISAQINLNGTSPNGTIDGKIKFQSKDAQGKAVAPTLELIDATSSGGSGEG